jgi:hypothetical protein
MLIRAIAKGDIKFTKALQKSLAIIPMVIIGGLFVGIEY